MKHREREAIYGRKEYYWGKQPNDLAKKTLQFVPSAIETPVLIDIGAGEGRDAVFFAEQGFDVYAIDVSPNGLAKAERLADERDVEIDTRKMDANEMQVPELVDVVYSAGTVQYIEPENRQRQFRRFRKRTTPGGIHVIFAFVDHPDVRTPPDWTENEHFYRPNELETYYSTWQSLDSKEVVFEDESGGEAHRHAAEIHVAKKPR